MTATVTLVELDPTMTTYRGVPIPEGAKGVEVIARSIADCDVRGDGEWTRLRPDHQPERWGPLVFRAGDWPQFPMMWRGVVDADGVVVA